MKLDLPDPTQELIRQVEAIIHPVYLVGGSVRDILLGRPPHDYDFATPLLPEVVENSLRQAGVKPYLTGKRFGTITAKIASHHIEITTFRTERYRTGSRKPEVEFIDDITYDLSRRDFTINAMALRPDRRLIDPFGGLKDLKHHLIRTVNHPFDRYNEDPLRMLRAGRFAAQLGFRIERETEAQALKKAHLLLGVSHERWTGELDKLLSGEFPDQGLSFLARTRQLHYMLPELALQINYDQHSPYHELSLWEHTLKTVSLIEDDLLLRWAALFHDIGKPYVARTNRLGYNNYPHHELVGGEMVTKIGHYLHWPKERTEHVASLVRQHLEGDSPLSLADSQARFRNDG